MVQVTFSDNGVIYDRHAFYQYDYGQSLELHGLDLTENIEVHFARKGTTAIVESATANQGVFTAQVPNDMFNKDGDLSVYICKGGKTYYGITFIIKPREIPENYNPPEEEQEIMSMQSPYTDNELLKELGMI